MPLIDLLSLFHLREALHGLNTPNFTDLCRKPFLGISAVNRTCSTTSLCKDNGCLFHDEIIPDGFDPFDAACDLARLVDGILRSNGAAQLDGTLVSLDTDLE